MKNKVSAKNDETTLVHLHLKLKNEYLTDYQKRMLKRYGASSTGDAICRDILIPSDMPLHNLYYAIQKLYGWQNSHLRSFLLPEEPDGFCDSACYPATMVSVRSAFCLKQ